MIAVTDLDRPRRFYEDGVSTGQPDLQVAWMRDPDGSVLTVLQATG